MSGGVFRRVISRRHPPRKRRVRTETAPAPPADWGHNFSGTANANIDKIKRVDLSSIFSVNGVDK